MTRAAPVEAGIPHLMTVADAAAALGVPEKSLLRAARDYGHLVQVGRALRIPSAELQELVQKCRCQGKAPASSSDSAPGAPPSGSSKTPGSPSVARAQATVSKLKSLSRRTSGSGTGQVVPLLPVK